MLAQFRQNLGLFREHLDAVRSVSLVACTTDCAPRSQEQQIREEYIARYGPPTLALPESMTSSRLFLALRLSAHSMDDGFQEAAITLFNDPLFLSGIVLSATVYLAAWAAPEPIFSKAFAASLTVALALCFSVAELRQVAMAFLHFHGEVEQARTLAELEAAAARFGRALGGTGLRVLLMVASYGIGKALPPVPSGGSGGLMAPARYALPEGLMMHPAATAQVVADGTIVLAGAALGTTSGAARAGSLCGDGTEKEGHQWHHIATDKNEFSRVQGGPWTPLFQELFERAGMNLSAQENLVYLKGHQGPHPEEYHRRIHRRLEDALEGCSGIEDCRHKLKTELRILAEEICEPGSSLSRFLTR